MRFAAILSLLVLFVLPFAAQADSKLENLGLSKDEPADGPSVKVDDGYMVPYTLTIPGSDVTVDMVPVPGGTFKLGSDEDEEDREDDEGPQVEVTVEPMWVAKRETSWKEYMLYMSMYQLFKDLEAKGLRKIDDSNEVDAVTAPTELYDPTFTFEFGREENLPAVTMTQYAAKQYTKWLAKLTGHQYRLPSEAEWEYACRGGSETAFHFGEDYDQLDDYAWYYDNSDDMPHPVGEKKPNQFGLHDMHGNVMELVIDNYTEDGYETLAEMEQPVDVKAAIKWPESYDNRTVRGGSFQDDPDQLRAAARLGSEDEDWKADDPNVPLSPWWYTTDPARGVGFRIFRSYNKLDDETISQFWNIQNEDVALDVEMRISEGRGIQSAVDPSLAKDIDSLNDQ